MKTVSSVHLSSGRRTLGPLQPSAVDEAVLVGSAGKRLVDIKKVDTKRRRLDFGNLENEPPADAGIKGSDMAVKRGSPSTGQQQQRLDVYVDARNENTVGMTPRSKAERRARNGNSVVVSRETYDLLLRDDESLEYWKMIAEQRRVALENALDENRLLHDEVELLTAENKHLQKVADQCAELAEVVKTLTTCDSDDEEGSDNETNGDTSTAGS